MSLLEEQLEEIRKRTAAAGVTPEMAQVAAAQPEPVAQDSLLPVPMSPIEKMMERDGKLKTMGKMLLGGFTGMTPFLMPELIGGKARYEQELKDYSAQQKLLQAQKMAEEYQGMLFDDDPSNDIEALQKGAIYQPDIYEPVLRDRLQRRLNPTEETFTEGDYEWNPETNRWDYVQVGNRGTINRTQQHKDFKPASRMASGQWIEEKTDETQTIARGHERAAGEAEYILQEMNDIGEDGWASGLQAEAGELYKRITGQEDQITAIRKEYEGVRVRNAISNLPPGVASDKDIQLALSPWPAGTANYKLIQKKLEAISRIERGRAKYERFRSNYIAENGTFKGLQEAWDNSADRLPDEQSSGGEERTWTFED